MNKMHHFFAYISRMRNIFRWGLMRNTHPENIAEHSLQTAMIAHALAIMHNKLGGSVDEKNVMALALYHETGEVITGDLPTPIKYFDPDIRDAYKKVEHIAERKMLSMLPADLQPHYAEYITGEGRNAEEWALVKAADRICAYLKCVEELKAGNMEFSRAAETVKKSIDEIDIPAVKRFMEEFVPSFSLTLDELN
ncbi:MAG: 5'-deoxynucleotidase [Clostridia bacterium]|nr:5'-deoxynucleotidase [Clostridia bacterium]